jgi:hypothetical protein
MQLQDNSADKDCLGGARRRRRHIFELGTDQRPGAAGDVVGAILALSTRLVRKG